MAIPSKRTTRSVITYLTREEVDAILAIPDQTTWLGSRDHALLLTLYNSGARASEITNLVRSQITFDSHTFVHLHGKGRKDRTVPLWKQTAQVLQVWFQKTKAKPEDVAFPTVRGARMSGDSLDAIIQMAVSKATGACRVW